MKRYEEIDFARAIPLLFLPIVHVYEQFLEYGFLTPAVETGGSIFLYLCAFGPSIFMMILGMNIAFSSHTSPRELTRRGVTTLLIFVVHNLIRFVIPGLIGALAVDPSLIPVVIAALVASDILGFAGLAFLFFALMKKIKASPFGIILLSLLLLALHTLLSPVQDWEGTFFNELLGNFVHVTAFSAFPALAWLIFPAIGYAMGIYMKSLQTEDALRSFYNKVGLASAVGLVSVCVCMYSYGLDFLTIAASPANDYITDLFNVLLDGCIAGIWFMAMYHIYAFIKRKASARVIAGIGTLSKSIMIFYLVQWVLVSWVQLVLAAFFYDEHNVGFVFMVLIALAITAASLWISIPLQKKLDRKKAARRQAALAR